MQLIVALRTRSEADWFASPHFANLEIRGGMRPLLHPSQKTTS